jgi:hypothetical protein
MRCQRLLPTVTMAGCLWATAALSGPASPMPFDAKKGDTGMHHVMSATSEAAPVGNDTLFVVDAVSCQPEWDKIKA